MPSEVPDRSPAELVTAAVEAIREIDYRDDRFADALLEAFFSASWPSPRSQDQ